MNGVNAPAATFSNHRYSPTGRHRNGTYSRQVQARSRTAIPTPSACNTTAQPIIAILL
jgi:hypothetical protein